MKIDRPIAIAIILFIILLLVFFLLVPEYNMFKKLRIELGEKRAQYYAEFDYYAEITKKYYELKNEENDLKKVDNALPTDPNFGKLVYFLQKTAIESGGLVKDIVLSNTTSNLNTNNPEGINNLVFSMGLIGDYSSLGNFLRALERSDRIFEVTDIYFGSTSSVTAPVKTAGKSQSKTGVQNTFIFNLQIKTHFY